MPNYLLAIDQGTTSSRAIVFSAQGLPVASAQQEFKQYFPQDGWVEHDGEELWLSTLKVCREALQNGGLSAGDVAAIGITNQRETTLVWDAQSGMPIHPAIVWQDRRTADYCAELKAAGHEAAVAAKTGLLIDPYFSATKLRWILQQVPGARERAERHAYEADQRGEAARVGRSDPQVAQRLERQFHLFPAALPPHSPGVEFERRGGATARAFEVEALGPAVRVHRRQAGRGVGALRRLLVHGDGVRLPRESGNRERDRSITPAARGGQPFSSRNSITSNQKPTPVSESSWERTSSSWPTSISRNGSKTARSASSGSWLTRLR